MSGSSVSIAQSKNQWLSKQVDVKYPTPESLAGRKLYLETSQSLSCQSLTLDQNSDFCFAPEDIFLVDFHRLTVLFAVLQSKRWSTVEQQNLIVEFLTQIIYSEPCELYLAFKDGEPKGAAIVTRGENELLISDIVLVDEQSIDNQQSFANALVNKLDIKLGQYSDVYLEI